MRKVFRIILYTGSVICALACGFSLLTAWSFWDIPITHTDAGVGGGFIPLTLGRDGISRWLLILAGILAVFSIGTTLGAKFFLKDRA